MSTHVCVAIILSRNAIAKNGRLTAPVPSSATQPRTCVPTQSPQYLIWLRFRAECAILLRVPATSRRAVNENEDLPSGHVNNNTRRWVCLPAIFRIPVAFLRLHGVPSYVLVWYRRFHVYQHVTSFSHMRGALVGRRTTAAGFHMQNMCDV